MISTTRAATIRAIFVAYMRNDRRVVEDALAEDFRFTSPYDDQIDKKTYFERCWKNSDWIERHELEKIFVEGDEAFVTYRCTAKGGKSFRIDQFYVAPSEQVNRIAVQFGAKHHDGAFIKQPE